MIESHWDGIIAWPRHRTSNSLLEATNSLIQSAKREARGYRSITKMITISYLIAARLPLPHRRKTPATPSPQDSRYPESTRSSEEPAVPREVSLAGTVGRYLDELKQHGAARAAPMTVHDQAYLKGPHALRQIRQQLPTVLVQAVDRAGVMLASGDDAAAAIDEAHRRPLSEFERGYVALELAAADAQVADLTQRRVTNCSSGCQ